MEANLDSFLWHSSDNFIDLNRMPLSQDCRFQETRYRIIISLRLQLKAGRHYEAKTAIDTCGALN